MFPIIPSHMLRQPTPVNRSPLATGHNLWTVWTDNLLSRSEFSRNFRDVKMDTTTADCVSESESEGDRSITVSGCFASGIIPKGTHSRAVDSFDLYAQAKDLDEKNLRLRVNSSGLLQAETNIADHKWIKLIKLSNDTQSNNAILEMTSHKQLCVRILRNLQPDEEVLLWFSEEILAQMYIPFLTPANIRGKNCYTCNVCEKSYENPNPLKIHLATNCNRYSQNELWRRLNQSPARHQYIYHPPYVSPEWAMLQQRLHAHSSAPLPPIEPEPKHRLSAFQPVHTSRYSQPPPERILAEPQDKSVANAAAHLETIVSNMGTSKQGHLCIYCGKLYSRKYGLKIHIRTHTGFKPLKCKYCFRPFGDPSNLNKHVRLHVQSNTVYKCNICDKILVRRRDLQRHMQTRHNHMGVEDSSASAMEGSSSNASSSSSDEDEVRFKNETTLS